MSMFSLEKDFIDDYKQFIAGHVDVSTTMIYTYVLNKPGVAVKSPVDR